MNSRGNVAASQPSPNELNPQPERRQRGYSSDTFRGGRGGRGYHHHNNSIAQNRNGQMVDRRIVSNDATPRGSPLRRVSQLGPVNEGPGPVFVHKSQSHSPPFGGDTTPRASSMQYSNQRNFTEPYPSNGQPKYSNDARLYNPDDGNTRVDRPWKAEVARPRAESRPQPAIVRPPFDTNPKAVILTRKEPGKCAVIYWYIGEPKKTYPEQQPRTVFASGFEREHFETHTLHSIFSRCGDVESISYLYEGPAQPTSRPQSAFVA